MLDEKFISLKYANAFYELFSNDLSESQISLLDEFSDLLSEHKNILMYMKLGLIEANESMAELKLLFKNYRLSENFNRLIDLLFKDNRITLLPEILKSIVDLYNKDHNIMVTVLESSQELTDSQKNIFKDFFARVTEKNIKLKEIINKDLIAGVKLYSTTKAWEFNVLRQIESLSYPKD